MLYETLYVYLVVFLFLAFFFYTCIKTVGGSIILQYVILIFGILLF